MLKDKQVGPFKAAVDQAVVDVDVKNPDSALNLIDEMQEIRDWIGMMQARVRERMVRAHSLVVRDAKEQRAWDGQADYQESLRSRS